MAAEKNLVRYLETETLLNEFFRAFDYCLKTCIPGFLEKSGGKPVAACCKNRYHVICDLDHPAYDRLRQEREIRFGKPEEQAIPADPVSPCEYHGPQGCVLKTHKSPICVAFMCRKSIDTLRETYGIFTYDYLGVYYALEWILTGDLSDASYQEFRESIEAMTRQVAHPSLPDPK
jgi:hypothetical protein